MVPKAGLEPAQLAPPPPQDGVSTNSTTSAFLLLKTGVNDGARTHDNRDHNPGLYQLSYVHHIKCTRIIHAYTHPERHSMHICIHNIILARPAGLEPATLGLEGRCSILMSYGRIKLVGVERFELPTFCSQSRRATRLRYTPLIRPEDRAEMILGLSAQVNY